MIRRHMRSVRWAPLLAIMYHGVAAAAEPSPCPDPSKCSMVCPVPQSEEKQRELVKKERTLELNLERADRNLEAAYNDVKRKKDANTAAAAELIKSPTPEAANRARAAAKALHDADDRVEDARNDLLSAEHAISCLQKLQSWHWTVGGAVHGAGGAGGAARWGVGVHWGIKHTPYSRHQLEVNYLELTNFDFDEDAYRRTGSAEPFVSALYSYAFKRLQLSLGLASRLDDVQAENERVWITGRTAVGFGVWTPKFCIDCAMVHASFFVEPWIPLDGNTPVTIVGGVELQLGYGSGPIIRWQTPAAK